MATLNRCSPRVNERSNAHLAGHTELTAGQDKGLPAPAFFLSCLSFAQSAGREHHHNLTAFELGVLLHLGELGNVGFHLVQ